MTFTRRSILAAGAATAATAAFAPLAPGSTRTLRTPRTTIIVSPHPDDETLYLSGYITYAEACGDELILLAVTDGGATKARPNGWTQEECKLIRRTEQAAAWRALTKGRGKTVRLSLPDGGRESLTDPVCRAVRELDGPDIEFYVAANDGQSRDHTAVAQGVRRSGVRVARFANESGSITGYRYPPVDPYACQLAANSYAAVGHRSVPSMFAALQANGYVSRVTR